MRDRELFAAMAMQALISREGWAADMVAKQAVAYADDRGAGGTRPASTGLTSHGNKEAP